MKFSETDGNFWDLIGEFLYHEEKVTGWSYNKNTDLVTIKSDGETTSISLANLNQMLKQKEEEIKHNWKTGNRFDGFLEDN